jgi:hypothetical protein
MRFHYLNLGSDGYPNKITSIFLFGQLLPDNFKSTLAEFLKANRSLLEILVLHKAHESYYSFFIDEMEG